MRIQPYRTMDHVIEGAVVNFVNISSRKQMEEDIKRQLSEKELLLREVHHRIKNNIAMVESLLSMQIRSVSNEEALAILQDAVGRVASMRVLYDKLLIQNDYEDSSVKRYIADLIESLETLFSDEARPAIEIRIDDFTLPSKTLFPLGIIVNELLTNTMKYAFADKPGGSVEVLLTKTGNQATLTIQDNGRGLPEGFSLDEATGFGFTLVKMLSEQLEGSCTIENREDAGGARSVVEFNV